MRGRPARAGQAQGERDFQARNALIKQWNIQQKAHIEAEYARERAELQESFRAKREGSECSVAARQNGALDMSSNLVSLTATQAVRLIHDGKLRAMRR